MNSDLFITGTDTGVGKTLVAAVLVAALNRKYWKPIQTGSCEGTDRQTVMSWTGVPIERTHDEAFVFEPPVSPHLAAEQRGIKIDRTAIHRPVDIEPLVIEGAGGVLVPISDNAFMIDLMQQLHAPVVLVTRTVVGTINHTLLSLSAIRRAKVEVRGVVMVGKENTDNRRAVERYGNAPIIGYIPWLDRIDRATLRHIFDQHFDKSAFV